MNPQIADQSGLDVDVWGGDATMPVLIPRSAEDCVATADGQCPPGCRQCLEFAETMGIMATENTENDQE